MSTCRICDKGDYQHHTFDLVRYSTRHSAHTDCGLHKWGAKFFWKFSAKQCEAIMPILLVKKLGLEDEFMKRIAATDIPAERFTKQFAYQLKMRRLAETA